MYEVLSKVINIDQKTWEKHLDEKWNVNID